MPHLFRRGLASGTETPDKMNDPKALFVTNAITREGIAQELNEYVSDSEDLGGSGGMLAGTPLTPDDARLTDEVCAEYARKLGEIDTDLDEGEQLAEIQWDTLVALGFVDTTDPSYTAQDEHGELPD